MKKVFTLLMALTMVIGFAGLASALDAVNCAGDPGRIADEGCSDVSEQSNRYCTPFDFENPADYCNTKQYNRAMFPVCDCIPEPFETVAARLEYVIGMKILVDKNDGNDMVAGDNYVYWAEDVNEAGISVETFPNQGEACRYTSPISGVKDYDGTPVTTGNFDGPFDYMLEDGTAGTPGFSSDCLVGTTNKVVEFTTNTLAAQDPAVTAGYVVSLEDDAANASNWVIDIPEMWANYPNAQAGWTVYVEVCITETGLSGTGGICGDCESCCFVLKIGTLCCDDTILPDGCEDTLTFPYFPTMANFWLGMAVTNTSDEDGDVVVTLYENDGDMGTATITVDANSTRIVQWSELVTDGTLGDDNAYAKMVADFPASGFAMFGNNSTGVAMGYIAERCSGCSCKY